MIPRADGWMDGWMDGSIKMSAFTYFILFFVAATAPSVSHSCVTDLDCSLLGECSNYSHKCICDQPWSGPSCGIMTYKITPKSGFSLFPESDPRNTWNGAIIRSDDGIFHLYNPLYPAGALGGTTTLMHGTSSSITGPYSFPKEDYITIPELGPFDGPKSLKFTDEKNSTKYSLWFGGRVYLANKVEGPFEVIDDFRYPGHNPAPLFHNGMFYNIESMESGIFSTDKLEPGAKWSKYASISQDKVPSTWIPEDPDMFVDKRGNWHIINHCYSNYEWENCSASVLSSHFFSNDDGKTW
eukprot:UC4_evm1s1384